MSTAIPGMGQVLGAPYPTTLGRKIFPVGGAGETGRLNRAQQSRDALGLNCFPRSVLEDSNFLRYLLWCQKSSHNEPPGENTKPLVSQDLWLDALVSRSHLQQGQTVSRVADTTQERNLIWGMPLSNKVRK